MRPQNASLRAASQPRCVMIKHRRNDESPIQYLRNRERVPKLHHLIVETAMRRIVHKFLLIRQERPQLIIFTSPPPTLVRQFMHVRTAMPATRPAKGRRRRTARQHIDALPKLRHQAALDANEQQCEHCRRRAYPANVQHTPDATLPYAMASPSISTFLPTLHHRPARETCSAPLPRFLTRTISVAQGASCAKLLYV
jgi:hypothetical protein